MDTVKADFNNFDTEIHRRLKEYYFANEGDKPNPEDWSDFMNHDEDFQVEFDRVFNNDDILEADETFTPYTYDDNYPNMELENTRGNDRPEYAQVTKLFKDKNGLPIGTKTRLLIQGCMRSSINIDIRRPSRQMQSHRTCLRKFTKRETVMFCLMRS